MKIRIIGKPYQIRVAMSHLIARYGNARIGDLNEHKRTTA